MTGIIVLFSVPAIGWLIYKSEHWEEGEWIKQRCRSVGPLFANIARRIFAAARPRFWWLLHKLDNAVLTERKW